MIIMELAAMPLHRSATTGAEDDDNDNDDANVNVHTNVKAINCQQEQRWRQPQ